MSGVLIPFLPPVYPGAPQAPNQAQVPLAEGVATTTGTHVPRGLKRLRSARMISPLRAFIQNLRHGHYELGFDAESRYRLPAAFAELALGKQLMIQPGGEVGGQDC